MKAVICLALMSAILGALGMLIGLELAIGVLQ